MGIQQQIRQAGSLDAMLDHQGFGASEGERGRLVPQEQVREVISAVIFLRSVPEIEVTPFEVLAMDDVRAQAGVADVTMGGLVREES